MDFDKTFEMLLSAGLTNARVYSVLGLCCRTGNSVDVETDNGTYRINVLYNGKRREDMDFWSGDVSDYLFDVWRI